MNLNAAFLIAGTGLAANGRATAVVASNVANALTEGYARREAVMAQAYPGAGTNGVRIAGVTRHVDPRVLGEARVAGGGAAGTGLLAGAALRAETALGLPGEPGALATALTRLETAFAEAAARPDVDARLAEVGLALADVAQGFARVTDTIQTLRTEADTGIASDVARLNDGLQNVDRLDRRIIALAASGGDVAPLQDERQRQIDALAEIVPLRELPRADGRTALVTPGGLALLDGRIARIAFQPVRRVIAEMEPGLPLGGLSVDGRPVAMNTAPALMDGGTLAARFALRNQAMPAAQAELDGLARDLVERLADPALDATRPPGAPGLLTDGGAAFDPANAMGLAGRLSINAAVDPAAGGLRSRLRDGIGAATPGAAGDGDLLARTAGALSDRRPTASAALPAGARSLADFAADVVSQAASRRLQAERADAQAGAQATTLRDAMAAGGVNTDAEMQRLLQLEQAYAANARVLSVVDALFADLLEAVR